MKRMYVNVKGNKLIDLCIYKYNWFRITKSMPLTNVGNEKYKYVLNAKEKKHLIIWLNSTNINWEITPDESGNPPKNNW